MLLDGQYDGVWIGLQDADIMNWPETYTNWSPVEPEHSVGESVLKNWYLSRIWLVLSL